MLTSIGRLLTQLRFDPVLFNSAEALRRHEKLDQAFCIVLDINLGDGVSGIELRRWLASRVTLPVIFVTGNDEHATHKAALQSGCIAYLRKPFSTKSLIEAIQSASTGPATQHATWRDNSRLDAD